MVNWLSGLLGEDMPPAVGVIAMFGLAILAIVLLLWIAKRILGGTFVAGGRARHLRLAVMDATPVDSRRRLVLVRRDDVEHLILIGGPTDVVVEQNIRLSPTPTAKQPNLAGLAEDSKPKAASETERIDIKSGDVTTGLAPAKKEFAPTNISERPSTPSQPVPVAPPRPAQVAPQRPAPLPPRSVEPQRPHPQPISSEPVRPIPAYVPPSSGPASTLISANYQPRTIAKPEPPVTTPVIAATAEIAPAPSAAKIERSEPLLAAAAVPLAGSILASESMSSNSDSNDALLLDLSDEIARVAGTETEAEEISLEEEMESLLADLDVKAERAS